MCDGKLRLYDSTDDLRGAAAKSVVTFVSPATYADISTNARTDNASTNTILALAVDGVYIGSASPFARITVDIATAGVGGGALVMHYYNGTNWTSEVTELVDGTASGGDTFSVDGVISFKPPSDWAAGNGGLSDLDNTFYYVFIHTTTNAGTDPVIDQLWPVDGQYFNIIFSQGNLTAPEGRKRPEEKVIFDRGRGDANTHYVLGPDDPIFEPLELSFSVRLDGVINKTALALALACGNPNYDTAWDATGVSTKTDTSFVAGDAGTGSFPAFADASKKTVCAQITWEFGGVKIGREYNGVYFPPDQLSLAESEDGVIISCTGLVYETIRCIYAFAHQY